MYDIILHSEAFTKATLLIKTIISYLYPTRLWKSTHALLQVSSLPIVFQTEQSHEEHVQVLLGFTLIVFRRASNLLIPSNMHVKQRLCT